MPKKETKFHGILAVGRTKADAKNNYRLLALSKGASMQVDSERNIAFVAQASLADGMFNPQSGNMDLETDDDLLTKLEFNSNSSGDVEVNHLVCESGCGAHVVFDSEALVKFCPNCTSELSESSDDDEDGDGDEDEGDEDDLDAELGPDGDDESSESADDEEGDESEEDAGDEEAGDEGDESEEAGDEGDEEGADEGDESGDADEGSGDDAGGDAADDEEADDLPDYTEDDGVVKVESSDQNNGLIIAASSYEEAERMFRENAPTVSLSAEGGVVEAHYMVCKDVECGAHLLSDQPITACCACQGDVEEPPAEPAAVVEPAKAAEPAKVEASGDGEDCDEKDGDEENTLELSDTDGNILNEDTEDVDAMADVEDEESDSANLDVSYSSSVAGQARWTAFFKGVPVAMASKSSAGKNADIFDTPSFGHAALATAKAVGVRKALSELGFEPIRHKVSVSREVRRLVDAQVAEARESLSAEQQQYKDRFLAALASAAIGLNRGFFAEKKNPIKATLWNAMSSAGIRNPESLIDSAFRSHSDAYHKTLFELASDLVSKSFDVQESISKAIQGMGYLEASTSNDQSLESRLETLGTSTSSGHVQQETQPATAVDRTNITKAVQTLGRRSR